MTEENSQNQATDDNSTSTEQQNNQHAGGAADTEGGGEKSTQTATSEIYKPDGLAEHYLGKDDRETIDKLNAAVVAYRKDLSKKDVPESVDGYNLELPDEMKEKVLRLDEHGKDPLVEKIKPILHKNNISNAAFQELATEFFGAALEMQAAVVVDTGVENLDFEYKNMGGEEKAAPQVEGAKVWIDGLVNNKKISSAAAEELKILTSHSAGLEAVVALRGISGAPPIPRDMKGQNPEAITAEKIEERWADPRSWKVGNMDDAFIEETRAMSRQLYG